MNQKLIKGQAVILAAGESSRFWPLNKKHKSLFKIMGRPLMWYALNNLKTAGIKQVIIVQNSGRDVEKELKKYSLPKFVDGLKFVVQKDPRGTGDALFCAKRYLNKKFLVINGDDYYGAKDLKKCLTTFPCILVKKVRTPSYFGIIKPRNGLVKGIVEKPKKPLVGLVNAGCYFLPKAVLRYKLKKSARGEYEITDLIKKLTKEAKLYFLEADVWLSLSYAWDLFRINEFLLKNIKSKIQGKLEKNCQIKHPVFVGKGTIIKSGTCIEGPVYIGEECVIGPNCYIRPLTTIENNCRIGQAVEIKGSIISDGSKIAHLSYVADSIIGENCNVGCGTVVANLRFDEKNVRAMVKGSLVDTGRRKFGAVLGKGVKVGINSSIMPGVLIGPDSIIYPHSLVKRNVEV